MSGHSKIEWTDATWNPVSGCTKESPGCKHCYAKTLHDKRHAAYLAGKKMPAQYARPFEHVTLHPDRLDWPLRWRGSATAKTQGRSSRIFVNSVSDLFHEDVPLHFLDAMFCIMALCPQHTFQILTKRAARMLEYVSAERRDARVEYWDRAQELFFRNPQTACDRSHTRIDDVVVSRFNIWPLPNVWLGVSVEDQSAADERISLLLQTPAAVRWISAEPLLGPLNLLQLRDRSEDPQGGALLFPLSGEFTCEGMNEPQPIKGGGITWVVTGGESGPRARPPHPDWFRSLRDQCAAAGVPFLFKQWGEWEEVAGEDRDPEDGGHLRIDVPSSEAAATFDQKSDCLISQDGMVFKSLDRLPTDLPCRLMARIGKARAGRLLDGVLHDEYPASPLTTTKESP